MGPYVGAAVAGAAGGKMPEVKAEVARKLVEDYGITIAGVARQVGVSTSDIEEPGTKLFQLVNNVPSFLRHFFPLVDCIKSSWDPGSCVEDGVGFEVSRIGSQNPANLPTKNLTRYYDPLLKPVLSSRRT